MAKESLNLHSLGSINADGSRRYIHPSDVRGPFMFWRRLSALALLVIYVALPWIPINGYPAVFLDVAQRRFHFMGLTFATQDLWLGFFLITGLAFSLFYVTALFGRVWCGWTCPYTIFLEHVYRRVERWIDGDAMARRRLENAPWTGGKIFRRVLKHGIYLAISTAIAHVFMSYFVSIKGLYGMMQTSPKEHVVAFGVVMFLTFALYGAFSWFREQFCVIMCPYGRLQSALTDDHSVIIGYDKKRGEPRGKASDPNAGDCIACNRCVQVCPTGIDIRNGLQLECIGCAACVDACDTVMAKLDRPKGLVRYDSHTGLHGGKTKLVRPRTIFYTVMLLMGVTAFSIALSSVKPIRASAVRMPGGAYYVTDEGVRNQFFVRVINKRNEPARLKLSLEGDLPEATNVSGLDEILELPAMGEDQKAVVISVPTDAFTGKIPFKVRVTDQETGTTVQTSQIELLGPEQKRSSDQPLNAKDYIQ
jgi:cytochrome c oxidase accessory protein FixG